MDGVSCVGAKSLGRLRGREEPSIKGVPNLPGREAGLLTNAESTLAIFWCRSTGYLDEESWESLSENSFRMALTAALTVGEGAFALSF